MTILQAIREVREGHAQRICAPGKWRVWREGAAVKSEILKGVAHG